MTKPTKWVCAQRTQISLGIRPVSSEYSLSARKKLGSLANSERTAKTLNRLSGCTGWSESSLGAQPYYWFCHVAAQISFVKSATTKFLCIGLRTNFNLGPWAVTEREWLAAFSGFCERQIYSFIFAFVWPMTFSYGSCLESLPMFFLVRLNNYCN